MVLVPATLLTGGSVDIGKVMAERSRLQAAADAASVAGASGVDVPDTMRIQTATNVFTANLTTSAVAPTVTVSGKAVTVQASSAISTPFLSLMSVFSITADVSSTATGTDQQIGVSAGKICLLALDPNSDDGIHVQGSNRIYYDNCWSQTNSTKATAINATSANSQARGAGHCAVGGYSDPGGGFTPAPTAGCLETPDPYAIGSAYSGSYTPTYAVPTKPATCKAQNLNLKKGTFSIDPGRYCGGITVQAGASVIFTPGEYYIDNGQLSIGSGANALGRNVMFYLSGALSNFSISGGGTVGLTGRESGNSNAGFLLIAALDACPLCSSNIQGGGSFALQGQIYVPKQRIEVAGNGDVNGAAINVFAMAAKDFYFRGNGIFKLQRYSGSGNVPDIMAQMPVKKTRKSVVTQ